VNPACCVAALAALALTIRPHGAPADEPVLFERLVAPALTWLLCAAGARHGAVRRLRFLTEDVPLIRETLA
jgi:hypothetical protein